MAKNLVEATITNNPGIAGTQIRMARVSADRFTASTDALPSYAGIRENSTDEARVNNTEIIKIVGVNNETLTVERNVGETVPAPLDIASGFYIYETITGETLQFLAEHAGQQGPKGDDGDRGATGPKGDTGDRGATGAKGDDGDRGADGVDGQDGADGARGDTGPKGDTGDRGATGAKGDDGDRGPTGPKGDDGDQGDQGPAGPAGAGASITVENDDVEISDSSGTLNFKDGITASLNNNKIDIEARDDRLRVVGFDAFGAFGNHTKIERLVFQNDFVIERDVDNQLRRIDIRLKNPTSSSDPITLNTEAEIDADDFTPENNKIYGLSSDPTDDAVFPDELNYFKHGVLHRMTVRFDPITSPSLFSPWHALGWSTVAGGSEYGIGGSTSPADPEDLTGIVRLYNSSTGNYTYKVIGKTGDFWGGDNSVSMRVYQDDGTEILPHITLTRTSGGSDLSFESAELSNDPLNLVTGNSYQVEFRPSPVSTEAFAFNLFGADYDHRVKLVDEDLLKKELGLVPRTVGNLQIHRTFETVRDFLQLQASNRLFTFTEDVSRTHYYEIIITSGSTGEGRLYMNYTIHGELLRTLNEHTSTPSNADMQASSHVAYMSGPNGNATNFQHDALNITRGSGFRNFYMTSGRGSTGYLRVRKIIDSIR